MRQMTAIRWLGAANVLVALTLFASRLDAQQAFRDCCEKVNGTENTYVCVDNGCWFTHDCTVNGDCVRTTV